MDNNVKVRRDYRNKDGDKLKGVTTILGVLNKPALVGWAYKMGKSGVPLYEKRDRAAEAGTLAHLMIERHLTNKEPPEDEMRRADQEMLNKARGCFDTFKHWSKSHQMKVDRTECELVSEIYQYGGTLDIVPRILGRRAIVDVKTSTGVYLEMKCQVVAYGELWEENYPKDPPQEYHIIQLAPDGGFTHKMLSPPSIPHYLRIFLCCNNIVKTLDQLNEKL